MSKFTDKIKSFGPIRWSLDLTKKIVLPGFEKIPLHDVGKFFLKGLRHGALNTRATSVSYYFFMAIFPSIIFLFTLIPYVPIDNFQVALFEQLRLLMPKAAFQEAESTIVEIISKPHKGVLTIGFILTIYYSTNGVNALIGAFNSTYHTVETRTWWQMRLISLLLVGITTAILISGVSLLIYTEYLFTKFFSEHKALLYYVILFGRWLILFAMFFISVSFIFYLAPSKKNKWKFFSAGSTMATLLSILVSVAFAYYVNNFGTYNKLYGSIGTLIMTMVWIYFNSFILLLGFELNASIIQAKFSSEDTKKINI